MMTLAIFPLPFIPLALIAIWAAIAGLSITVFRLVIDKKIDPQEKLQKLDAMKASGVIKTEEYDKARQMILDKFVQR